MSIPLEGRQFCKDGPFACSDSQRATKYKTHSFSPHALLGKAGPALPLAMRPVTSQSVWATQKQQVTHPSRAQTSSRKSGCAKGKSVCANLDNSSQPKKKTQKNYCLPGTNRPRTQLSGHKGEGGGPSLQGSGEGGGCREQASAAEPANQRCTRTTSCPGGGGISRGLSHGGQARPSAMHGLPRVHGAPRGPFPLGVTPGRSQVNHRKPDADQQMSRAALALPGIGLQRLFDTRSQGT